MYIKYILTNAFIWPVQVNPAGAVTQMNIHMCITSRYEACALTFKTSALPLLYSLLQILGQMRVTGECCSGETSHPMSKVQHDKFSCFQMQGTVMCLSTFNTVRIPSGSAKRLILFSPRGFSMLSTLLNEDIPTQEKRLFTSKNANTMWIINVDKQIIHQRLCRVYSQIN